MVLIVLHYRISFPIKKRRKQWVLITKHPKLCLKQIIRNHLNAVNNYQVIDKVSNCWKLKNGLERTRNYIPVFKWFVSQRHEIIYCNLMSMSPMHDCQLTALRTNIHSKSLSTKSVLVLLLILYTSSIGSCTMFTFRGVSHHQSDWRQLYCACGSEIYGFPRTLKKSVWAKKSNVTSCGLTAMFYNHEEQTKAYHKPLVFFHAYPGGQM